MEHANNMKYCVEQENAEHHAMCGQEYCHAEASVHQSDTTVAFIIQLHPSITSKQKCCHPSLLFDLLEHNHEQSPCNKRKR